MSRHVLFYLAVAGLGRCGEGHPFPPPCHVSGRIHRPHDPWPKHRGSMWKVAEKAQTYEMTTKDAWPISNALAN